MGHGVKAADRGHRRLSGFWGTQGKESPVDARQNPAYRIELALLQTLTEVAAREGLADAEIELATANLFCTMLCTLGMKNGMPRAVILRHARDLGPLLVKNVRTKLDHSGPPAHPERN